MIKYNYDGTMAFLQNALSKLKLGSPSNQAMSSSNLILRVLIEQEMNLSDYWRQHHGDGESNWTPVTLNVLRIDSDTRIKILEGWLRDLCGTSWSWRGIVPDSKHINITFFFADKNLAMLFKLTFG